VFVCLLHITGVEVEKSACLEPINRFSALLNRLDKCLMEGQHKE